jgi:hypothetical protein
MKNGFITGLKALVAMIGMLLMVGCSCTPSMAPRDIHVLIDNSLRTADGKLKSVQVDMIAVNAGELERWKMESLQNYWTPGKSALATAADKVIFKFDPTENIPEKTFPKTHAVWDIWGKKEAMDLVIVADIPGFQTPQAGMADPRRQIITLNGCRWDNTDPIQVSISSAGVVILTQPKPDKK